MRDMVKNKEEIGVIIFKQKENEKKSYLITTNSNNITEKIEFNIDDISKIKNIIKKYHFNKDLITEDDKEKYYLNETELRLFKKIIEEKNIITKKKAKKVNKYLLKKKKIIIPLTIGLAVIIASTTAITKKKSNNNDNDETTFSATIDNTVNNNNNNNNNNEINQEIIIYGNAFDHPSELKEKIDNTKNNNSTKVNYINQNEEITINNIELEDYEIEKYKNTVSYYNEYFNKVGTRYGIDPILISQIATTERGIHSETKDDGGAIGLCQIQVSCSELDILKKDNFDLNKAYDYIKEYEIKCYNFETNQEETLIAMTDYTKKTFDYYKVDLSNYRIINLGDLEDNITMCAAILQNNLKEFNGNLPTSIIAYNQGQYAVENYIKQYAQEKNIDYNIALNYAQEWQKYIPDDYGDKNYLDDVLRYNIINNLPIKCKYIDKNNQIIETTLTILENKKINSYIKK